MKRKLLQPKLKSRVGGVDVGNSRAFSTGPLGDSRPFATSGEWLDFLNWSSVDDGGDNDWVSPANAKTQNDSYAESSGSTITITNSLQGLTLSKRIPDGVAIGTILLQIDRWCFAGRASDLVLRPVIGGVPVGTNKAKGTLYPTSDADTYELYTPPWGVSPTIAQLNSLDTGIRLSCDFTNIDGVNIDHIQMAVGFS